MFDIMVREWKAFKRNIIDPLGQPFVPLSDSYFINMFIKKDNEICNEAHAQYSSMKVETLFLIYVFQIFLRTNFKGFEEITKVLH